MVGIVCLSTGSYASDILPKQILIRSAYRNPDADQSRQNVTWQFLAKEDGQYEVSREGDASVLMVLHYDADHRLRRVENRMSETQMVYADDPMVLSWGFPIPFDDLAPKDKRQGKLTLIKVVGDTRFAYTVHREVQPISVQTAIDEGFIIEQAPMIPDDASLTLITVRYNDSLIARQLWLDGDHWWLYEETDVRRSWRLLPSNPKE